MQGLVVSCQAFPGEALFGSEYMTKMAIAACQGGASGIRANGPQDIAAIKQSVSVPVIGLMKNDLPGFEVRITPTLEDALIVHRAGADIVAIDATSRPRPDNRSLSETVRKLKELGITVMADVSTFEEGLNAAALGVDYISTTLSGYTSYSRQIKEPDLELVARLASAVSVPVAAEGRIKTPEEAAAALRLGASLVVVGGAITRPQMITAAFVSTMNQREAVSE
ncbi:N-acetylmannosamine-6-phosphate 2-epimerase [Paenibacillus montanisoli]|uniref:Putative N-acetylmannosamine-6-phosphate 2-epimerase n=1 Tax=Paenibacillus montanisoli TaxID=2081970 RepID=A0A328UBD7_9BACL|nr:N-acetylmannosamine-6-phosphate 2-epimerase [Paenibacillus montanisoli]